MCGLGLDLQIFLAVSGASGFPFRKAPGIVVVFFGIVAHLGRGS